jgi:hypothetical protein
VAFKFFNYPQQAIFGKVLPKSKIYEFAKPSNAVKELFIKQVEQIIWQYKLSPETINTPHGEGVQEIQILKIDLRVPDVDKRVFQVIDQAIPSHIFYEIAVANKLKLVAAFKRPSDTDASKWVTGTYFESDWFPNSAEKRSLPISLNMGSLYAQMLREIMPIRTRPIESLREQVDRLELLQHRKAEIDSLKIRLGKENQFNRKLEINSRIREVQRSINELLD